ncbi:MAG: prepilin-type N-terminal cleavage/methylation domain-containing protein [Candidatus Jorgensenbacteria bacterium]
MTSKRSGFTLIEMLVVVAIIGLLASVVVVGVGGARQRARDAKRIADIRQIQNMLENYYSTNNAYPTALNLLPSVPTDPLDATKSYGYSGSAQTYILGTCLENDRPAGTGSVAEMLVLTNLTTNCTNCNQAAPGNLKVYCVKS